MEIKMPALGQKRFWLISYNDKTLKIDWKVPNDKIILSIKDTINPLLNDIKL